MGAHQDPIFPIISFQGVSHIEWATSIEIAKINFHAMFEIIRINTFSPAIALLLLQSSSSETQPGLVEPDTIQITDSKPNMCWCTICNQLEKVI
jgi:hypothetical protein